MEPLAVDRSLLFARLDSGFATMKAGMAHPEKIGDSELTRQWVETWRRAGKELEEIRRREMHSIDTPAAVRQLLGSTASYANVPPRTTSGLVEQQAWFSKLRR